MSHYSSVFSRVPLDMPNRSGFDCSHENLGTAETGTLIPVLVDELLPNDTISLGSAFQVQLPPMAGDFYGRVDFVLEAFFVPARLLWGGWQSFMTHPTANPQYPVNTPVQGKSKYLPKLRMQVDEGSGRDQFGPGTLSDYLGFKCLRTSSPVIADVNMLPYLAYHRIWDDWYRDSRIQAPLFYKPNNQVNALTLQQSVAYKPYYSGGVDQSDITITTTSPANFVDGVNISSLRQRNWSKDYFTTASTLPQAGNASQLTFDVDTTNASGTFSIAALRAANALQIWMERNNISGYRYSDQIYAQYGIYPSDAIMDKCIYLGRHTQNVYTRSVFQTANSSDTSNPFNTVGAKYGSSMCIGEGSLIDSIRVTEHGYLMVLASLVPHAYYGTGTRRYLTRSVVGDIAFPMLSGMGDQSIYAYELTGNVNNTEVFGYTDRYAEYKYHDDEVHGLLRDGQNLSHLALQRGFEYESTPALGTEFLQIPTDYLDQVMAVSNETSGFSCWYDIYFPYKKVSTLPQYSLPTLADMKHVHTKYMSRGGKRL